VFVNLYGHVPDLPGLRYWVGQITDGIVGLGAAALDIANGATGSDAIGVRNKLAVALDFTTRTKESGLGLGGTAPLPPAFVAAARTVLAGVDGRALNDASTTACMNATTAFSLTAAPAGSRVISHAVASDLSDDPVTISISDKSIDPGLGDHMIRFIASVSGDTLVLHANGLDQVYGFDPSTDVLDLRSLLREANVDLDGNTALLGNFLTVADQGADALLRFDPTEQGGGSAVAVLSGLGGIVTGLDALATLGAIKIS